MGRYAKLIMVTGENNNKYYEMKEVGSNIEVTYGRVDSTAVKKSYASWEWDTIFNSKVKKGYKDVTDLVTVTVDTTKPSTVTTIATGDMKIDEFLTLMKKYTDNLVKNTYSVQAVNVSQKQVDKAQDIINQLTAIGRNHVANMAQANQLLLDLYMVIPRYMGNTKNSLLPFINFNDTLQQEQDNLDAMASQVKLLAPKKATKMSKKSVTLLDQLGIKLKEVKNVKEVEHITKQLNKNKIDAIYQVEKNTEDVIFNNWLKTAKNKETRLLIHGTRCTSVIPILEQGLKIRPVGNFQFSGKAYGDGNYFSEVTQKSLGYTGHDSDQILLVYEVHTGNPFKYSGWYNGNSFPLTYTELSKRGFDSTHVSAGNGLLNSEIIAYKEQQSRIKYIIHLKR